MRAKQTDMNRLFPSDSDQFARDLLTQGVSKSAESFYVQDVIVVLAAAIVLVMTAIAISQLLGTPPTYSGVIDWPSEVPPGQVWLPAVPAGS